MFPHLDALQSVFFARQLEEIDTQLYDVKYGALEALELVSAKPLNIGAESYTYRSFDARGIAKMTSNYASGSPRADVSGKEDTSLVRSIRASFGFNVQEIRAASMAGLPLDAMRAMAARRMINEKLNSVALLGDAEHNLVGLFNQSNTTAYTIPADGTAASALWTAKTPDLILRDLFGMVDKIPSSTAEVEKPKRLLMPYKDLRYINRLRMSTADAMLTVLKYFQTMRPDIEVRGALLLDNAGSGGVVSRMVAYDPNRINQEWLLPIPFETFPPQLSGMEYVTECHARCGGVVVRYPLSICYADGASTTA